MYKKPEKIDMEIVCDSVEVEVCDTALLVKLKNIELECVAEDFIKAIKERDGG